MNDLFDSAIVDVAVNQIASQAVDAVQAAVGKKLVGDASRSAGAVYDWVKGRLTGIGRQAALERVETHPADAENRVALKVELRELLENNVDAYTQLAELLGPVMA